MQNRVPKIDNTLRRPRLEADGRRWTRRCAHIFDAYRGQVADARGAGRMSARQRASRCTSRSKVDVDTLRGTREGVPRWSSCCAGTASRATFLFSLGPDHTGRAIRRVFRPGFVGKVQRTSVVRHYGVRTLLYGTLLPGPDIGRRGARRACARVRDAGHETGIHCWDHVRWQDGVARRRRRVDASARCSARASATREIFREPPRTHGAAGWQMNVHALRLTQRLGFDYCSRRPRHASAPAGVERRADPLPAVSDDAADARRADRHRRRSPRTTSPRICSSARASRADAATCSRCTRSSRACSSRRVFEQLLLGWKAQGWSLGPVRALLRGGRADGAAALRDRVLARCRAARGTLLVQGDEFLGDVDLAQAA